MESKGIRAILYSIVTALILSVILFLLVPRLLFKGDARWTYQNDTARVDVSFSGHLKNARVVVEGTNVKLSQPAWLSNKSYQGTVVELPVSYRTKLFQIKLSPKADAWGEDATLIIKFRGQDFRHKGKRRPAWVTFRNITLNGEPIAGEKVVCHDTPFVLKYPPHSSPEIPLTFEVCKPFAASDISLKNLLAAFFACLILSLIIASPSRVESIIPDFINRKDIVRVISDGYRHIDPVYRRSFWIIFGVLCFALGFHAICFMWGKNDWLFLDHTRRWLEHRWSGRYMVYSIKALLSSGVYLPLIYDLLTSITLALNAVLLCKYWRLEKRVAYFVLCGLVLTAQPFTLGMVYYVDMTPEVFIGVTCVLVALLLSENIANAGEGLTRKLTYSFIAIVLVNFALAMYPVLITTVAVVFVGRLLVQAFDWDGSWQKLKSCHSIFMIPAINIVLGIALYKLILTFVFPPVSHYNTTTLPLDQIPERLGVLFRQSLHQLYEYDMPFLHQWILWVFLGLLGVLAIHACSTGMFRQRIVRLFLLFGSLFATQTAMIIAKSHRIEVRIELFGLVFFEVLMMILVLTRFRKFRNLWIITGACVVFASIINDLDCLRVWKLGFDAEKMLWNRMLIRLETRPEFDPNKKYKIIQIGEPISMRERYYTDHIPSIASDILKYSYDNPFNVFVAPEFYYPTPFRNSKSSPPNSHCLDYSQLMHLYRAGVLQKAEVWPKENGLIVWKDIILFVTDEKGLNNAIARLERELGKK